MKTMIVMTIIAIAAALLPGQMLELQRGGEPWRIVTCHFTHWTHEQLVWDGLAFTALGIACARRHRPAFQAMLLASVVAIPIAVLMFASHLQSYRGLSGIASAFFAFVLMDDSRPGLSKLRITVALLFFAKLAYEFTTGGTVFVQDMGPGVVAVPIAHVTGACIGLIAAAFTIRPCALQSSSSPL
jgi:rhomboid family GlyGly-CTERM serine protease